MTASWWPEVAALKYTPWYRWHPQLAIRYLPVVEWIKRLKRFDLFKKGRTLTILEVGSGGLGVTPYLKLPVTGLDVKFDPPFHPLLKRVVGKAEKLEFTDNSFDVVLSMDMLEHLPISHRQQAIAEMFRVAINSVVIGVPCGKSAAQFDRWLHQQYKNINRSEYQFLHEQVEYGVPTESEIKKAILKAAIKTGKSTSIHIVGNSNIGIRRFLMRGWLSRSLIVNFIFRKVFLLFIPWFRWAERPPYYRQLFFVTIEKSMSNEQKTKSRRHN